MIYEWHIVRVFSLVKMNDSLTSTTTLNHIISTFDFKRIMSPSNVLLKIYRNYSNKSSYHSIVHQSLTVRNWTSKSRLLRYIIHIFLIFSFRLQFIQFAHCSTACFFAKHWTPIITDLKYLCNKTIVCRKLACVFNVLDNFTITAISCA